MSNEEPEPGSPIARALALQVQQREANEATVQAFACLTEKPEEALRLLSEARRKWDASFRDQEAWLHQQVEQMRQQIQELREAAVANEVFLLNGEGQAAYLLGRLVQARAAFEGALSLLGDQPSIDRAMILLALANVDLQAGWNGQPVTTGAGETPYDRAFQECLALEQWPMAVEARASAANWAHFQGERDSSLRHIDEAIQLAETHELEELERKLRIKRFNFRLTSDPTGETLQNFKIEFKRLKAIAAADKSELIDVLVLAASQSCAQKAVDTADELLQEAQSLAESEAPARRWSVQLELSRLAEIKKDPAAAIGHAEEALRLARASGISMQIAAALRTLIPLRAGQDDAAQDERMRQDMEDLRRSGATDELVLALLLRAAVYHGQQRFELALADNEEARQCALTREAQRRALMAKMAALHALNRDEEALDTALQAIALLDQPGAPDMGQPLNEWQDRIGEVEALHAAAAWLTASSGRAREAFNLAEAGKAQSLRRQLARAAIAEDSPATDLSQTSFEELRDHLASESSAMAMFCVTAWGTLVLVVEPRQDEPLACFVELAGQELKDLLSLHSASQSSELWTDVIFGAVPALSEKLLQPLQDTLREVAGRCETLYIVPDASLYLISFAALTFTDGTRLVEHVAVAHVPSACILAWCRSRRRPRAGRTCLATGIGRAGEYSFAEQARAVAELPWASSELLPEATREAFLSAAPRFTALFLSCHGAIQETVLDTLSASRFEFADGSLTAKDVFQLGGRLPSDLVFLNACQSGHFKSEGRSDVDGYWRAFLHAGAASLIATLTFVHPGHAGQLALDFHQEWLKGDVTKAEALRRVQLGMLRQGVEPRHWASHILIGDAG